VPRGVDEVDDQVADRERADGGLDGDPTSTFLGECVGAGIAGVNTAEAVDSSGVEE